MRRLYWRPATAWSTTVILCLSIFTSACGLKNYDITNATDRAAMKVDIQNALTNNNCATALETSYKLYNSEYSDNEVRLLYASAHGCNIGIQLYTLINNLAGISTTNPIGDFARFFPSTTSDSRLASSWYATDALFAILNPGAVVSPVDRIFPDTSNIGSVRWQDRTDDGNVYLMFIGMATVGTTLNRFGSPTGTYTQGTNLVWETKNLVDSDNSNVACGIASGFLNFFDGAHRTLQYLSPSTASSMTTVVNLLEDQMTNTDLFPGRNTWGGNARCMTDFNNQTLCDAAKLRLRSRSACKEQPAAASFAAGMIGAINDLWL